MAFTLASRLHVAWQVESQAPEVAQPEVLGLAALGNGALLLLVPQPPLIDVERCVEVAEVSLGPAHGICRGERSTRLWLASPAARRRELSSVPLGRLIRGLCSQPAKPQLTCLVTWAQPPAPTQCVTLSPSPSRQGRCRKPGAFSMTPL